MEPNWNQDRPTTRECLNYWNNHQVFQSEQIKGSGVEKLLSEMNNIFKNGGAKFGCFSFEIDELLHWFVSRNRFDEICFFENLLSSSSFREVFPDVTPYEKPRKSIEWEWSNPYVLSGEIAHWLMTGGAYEKFDGTGKEAMEISRHFTNDLYGERFENIQVFKHYGAWSKWFNGIVWDGTWIGVDVEQLLVWTLFVTDTD